MLQSLLLAATVGTSGLVESLSGTWKFKGFDRQADAFGALTQEEARLLSPESDDSKWYDIKVPLNWWRDPAHHIDKVQKPGEIYYRGYYRRTIDVENPKDGCRRILQFAAVGRSCDLLVNGRFVRSHFGEFTPFEADITDFLVPGTNLIALRVLADLGPKPGELWRHGYGARWGSWILKGGIWQEVALLTTPADRFRHVLIDTMPSLDSVRVRWNADLHGGAGDVAVSATIRDADGRTVACGAPRAAATANGVARGAFDLTAKGVRQWSPENPALYHLEIRLLRNGREVASRTERFGFRRLEIRGTRFLLNGEPIYFQGDTAQSGQWGGNGIDERKHAFSLLMRHKANGVNVLRTAHMPTIREVYGVADELGIIIYDEWSSCALEKVDEPSFERNNLAGLREFILAHYNHPSVAMYSLGNEICHRVDPALPRQLDKQYDLVKRLDTQGRPVCSFSGNAGIGAYGTSRIKTDFLDLHNYIGIENESWTRWFPVMDRFMKPIIEVYGENGRLTMPLVMFECVGAGWGVHREKDIKPGDPKRYADYLKNPCPTFTGSGNTSTCFSKATGLYRLVDPVSGGAHFIQSYLARRLSELYLQDGRIAGYAPWFGDVDVPGVGRWMQKVYPLLRRGRAGDRAFMPRQLTSPGQTKLECVVVNKRPKEVLDAKVVVTFEGVDGREIELGVCSVGNVPPMGEKSAPFGLVLPSGLPARGKIKLRHESRDRARAWNDYDVTVHSADAVVRASKARRRYVSTAAELPATGAAVVGPSGWHDADAPLRDFVRRGGTLLVLEPSDGAVPGFPELFVYPWSNHLVDLVMPAHPAFCGLTQEDFDLWAENPYGDVVSHLLHRLDEGLLAGIWKGQAVGEYAYGKGRVLVSTVAASAIADRNPAAAKYLSNLIAYAYGRGKPAAMPAKLEDVADRTPVRGFAGESFSVPTCPATLDFAAGKDDRPPAKIFFFNDEASRRIIGQKGLNLVEIRYRSSERGRIDLTLPKKDHTNRLTFTLPVSADPGTEKKVVLDLEKDFRYAKPDRFPLSDIRGELIIYNGYERDCGFPRPPIKLELLSVVFRKAMDSGIKQ